MVAVGSPKRESKLSEYNQIFQPNSVLSIGGIVFKKNKMISGCNGKMGNHRTDRYKSKLKLRNIEFIKKGG